MATNIDFRHFESGVTLTLELRDYGTGGHAVVNPTSTATAVVDAVDDPRRYRCEISEDVAVGWYIAEWFEGGDLVGAGSVYVSAANTGTYEVGSVPAAVEQVKNGLSTFDSENDKVDLVDAPNAAAVTALQNGVSTFDPATDTVARVTLVDTCTANTDMRGTNGAITSLSGIATETDVADAAYNVIVALPSVPSTSEIATAVWSASTRTLSSFGTLVADIATAVWSATTRTLSGFSHKVTVEANEDKTGYSLQTSPPTKEAIAGQVRTELTTELGLIDAAVSSRLAPTTAGMTLNVEEDGTIAVSVDEGVLTEAVENAVNNAVGDGVLISDASVAKLAGTVVRFEQPTWTGKGFDRPIVIGASYLDELRLKATVTGWHGQPVGEASLIRFTGSKVANGVEESFSFDVDVASNVSTEASITTILVPLAVEQTQGVKPGVYECDIVMVWGDSGVVHTATPMPFKQEFRSIRDG